MRGRTTFAVAVALVGVSPVVSPVAPLVAPLAADATSVGWNDIEALAGEWEGTTADGQPVTMSFESVAEGTAMLERLVIGHDDGAHEMATLYHPDGDSVRLTHYCATGNQPRMVAAASGGDGLDFELVDVTGLETPAAGHMRAAELSFPADDRLRTAWTWHEGGADAFTVTIDAARRVLMSEEERGTLLDHLDRTAGLLRAAVDGLTPEQWTFRSADDRWTILEVAEHLALSEDFIRGAIEGALDGAAMTETAARGARHDRIISSFVVDRSRKFQAPEPVRPAAAFDDLETAMAAFDASRERSADLVGSARDLRAYQQHHPLVDGPLDAYGWVLFMSGHTERHTLQIEEIKAAPGFPAASSATAAR